MLCCSNVCTNQSGGRGHRVSVSSNKTASYIYYIVVDRHEKSQLFVIDIMFDCLFYLNFLCKCYLLFYNLFYH
jgi:hypothetical protein